MAAKKKSRKSTPPTGENEAEIRRAADQRRGEAATVAWTTTAVFALFGEVMALGAMGVIALGVADPFVIRLVGQIGLLIGCFAGLFCLILTPIVLRFAQAAPPAAVTWFNLAVSIAPWTTAVVQWLGDW